MSEDTSNKQEIESVRHGDPEQQPIIRQQSNSAKNEEFRGNESADSANQVQDNRMQEQTNGQPAQAQDTNGENNGYQKTTQTILQGNNKKTISNFGETSPQNGRENADFQQSSMNQENQNQQNDPEVQQISNGQSNKSPQIIEKNDGRTSLDLQIKPIITNKDIPKIEVTGNLQPQQNQNNPTVSNRSFRQVDQPIQSSDVNIHRQKESARATEEENMFQQGDDEEKKINFPIIDQILESTPYQIFITFITIYALFGDDIRVMATNKHADIGFDIVTIIALIIFAIEIFLNTINKPTYLWSFFFWLDVISTISLLIDIQMLANQIFYGDNSSSTSANASQVAQAGKASRVGTKAGRVVRLVRLIRIVKLYKLSQEQQEMQNEKQQKMLELRQQKKQIHPTFRSQHRGGIYHKDHKDHIQVPQNNQKRGSVQSPNGTKRESVIQQLEKPPDNYIKESRVSKRLSDLTTKRVIVLVLLLLFIMPLFSADYYFDPPSSIKFQTKLLKNLSQNGLNQSEIIELFDSIVDVHRDKNNGVNNPLVLLEVPFTFIDRYKSSVFNDLRLNEQDKYSYKINFETFQQNHSASTLDNYDQEITHLQTLVDDNEATVQGTLSTRSFQILTAGLSFGRTLFVCIVLTCGALFFSKDANDIALRPIEQLIEVVNQMAKDPISAKTLKLSKDDNNTKLETYVIENAIVKIGMLLALGFGDAGSEIIGQNMKRGGDVDPMIPGQKKCAIYGFCDIRRFTDATEVLQEDVMVFVNNIGDVVHSMTDRFQGAANKNIGDAFLLVWKIPQEQYNIKVTNEVEFVDQTFISKLADMSLLAFMKIQVKLNREPQILEYRKDKRLQDRMKDYKVKLGYGLHIGWGIEGAIGSEYKIDASYLSPNVNMAARLEAATKQFGTPILISQALQEIMTEEMQQHTRQIDRVTVKGSNQPIGLFTVDQQLEGLPSSKEQPKNQTQQQIDDRKLDLINKKTILKQQLISPDATWNVNAVIAQNKDLRISLTQRDENYYHTFAVGFQNYLTGDWSQAKAMFDKCKQLNPEDGPLLSLLDVMGEKKFQAPSDWSGYRMLTEK